MYDKVMKYKGWIFEIDEIETKYGKTTVIAQLEINDDIEEKFYIEEEYLSEYVCEELYNKFLYVYGNNL